MNARSKILAAALGLLVAGGAVADASAATIVKKTVTHRISHPVLVKKVRIVHHRHVAAVRVLPGHRIAPRLKVARVLPAKHIVKTTVIR